MQSLFDQNRKTSSSPQLDGKTESFANLSSPPRYVHSSVSGSILRRPGSGGSASSSVVSGSASSSSVGGTNLSLRNLNQGGSPQTAGVNFFNLRNTSVGDPTTSTSAFSAQSRAAGLALLRKGEDELMSTRSDTIDTVNHLGHMLLGNVQPGVTHSGSVIASSANVSGRVLSSSRNPSPKLDSFSHGRRAEIIRKQREDLELLHQEKLRIALNAQDARDEKELESILAEDKSLMDSPNFNASPPKMEPKLPAPTLEGLTAEVITSPARPGSSGNIRPKQSSPKFPVRSYTTISSTSKGSLSSPNRIISSNFQKGNQPSVSGKPVQHLQSLKSPGFDGVSKRSQQGSLTSLEKSPALPPSRKGLATPPSTSMPHLSLANSATAPKLISLTSGSSARRKSSTAQPGSSPETSIPTILPKSVTPMERDIQQSQLYSQSQLQLQQQQQQHEQQTNDTASSLTSPHITHEQAGFSSEPNSPVPSGFSEVSLRAVLASASERHLAARLNIPNIANSQANLFRNRPSYLGVLPSKANQQSQSAKKDEEDSARAPPPELSPFEALQVTMPYGTSSIDEIVSNGIDKKDSEERHSVFMPPKLPQTANSNQRHESMPVHDNVISDRLSEYSNVHDSADFEYQQTSPIESGHSQANSPNIEFGFASQLTKFDEADRGGFYSEHNQEEDVHSNGVVIQGDELSVEGDGDFTRYREADKVARRGHRRNTNASTRRLLGDDLKLQQRKYESHIASHSPKQRNVRLSIDRTGGSDSVRQSFKEESMSRRRSSSSNSALSTSNARRGSGSSTGAQVYNLFLADDDLDNEDFEDFEDFVDVSQHDEDEHDYQGDDGGQYNRRRRKSRRAFGNDAGEATWDGYDGDSDSMAVLSESLFDLLNDADKERTHPRTRERDQKASQKATLKPPAADKSPQNVSLTSPDQTPQLLPNLSRSVSLTLSGVSSAAATAAPSEAWGGKSTRNIENHSSIIQEGEKMQNVTTTQSKSGFESDRSLGHVPLAPQNSDLMVLSDIGIDTATSSRSSALEPSPKSSILEKGAELGLKLSIDISEESASHVVRPSRAVARKPMSPNSPGSTKGKQRPASRVPSIANMSRFEDSDSLAFDSDVSPLNNVRPKRKSAMQFSRGGLARNRALSMNTQSARQRFDSEYGDGGEIDTGEAVFGENLSTVGNRSPISGEDASNTHRKSLLPKRAPVRTSTVSPHSPKANRLIQKLPRLSITQTVTSEMDSTEREALRSHTSSLSSSLSPRSSGRSSFSAQSVHSAHFTSSRSRSFSTTPKLFKSPFISQKSLSKTPVSRKLMPGSTNRSLSVVTKRIPMNLPASLKASRDYKNDEPDSSSERDHFSTHESTLSPDVLDRALKAVAESIHALKATQTQMNEGLNAPVTHTEDEYDEAEANASFEDPMSEELTTNELSIPAEAIHLLDEYERIIQIAKRKMSEETCQYWLAPLENNNSVQGHATELNPQEKSSNRMKTKSKNFAQLAYDFVEKAFQNRKEQGAVLQVSESLNELNISDLPTDSGSEIEDNTTNHKEETSFKESIDDKPADLTMRLALQHYAHQLVQKGTLPNNPLPAFIASQLRKSLVSTKKQVTQPLVSRRCGNLVRVDQLISKEQATEAHTDSDDLNLISKLEQLTENSKQNAPNIGKLKKALLRHLAKEDRKDSTVEYQARPNNTSIKPLVASKFETKLEASRKAKIEERRVQTTERAKVVNSAALLVSDATNDILHRRVATAPVRRNLLQRDYSIPSATVRLNGLDQGPKSFALLVGGEADRRQPSEPLQEARLTTTITPFTPHLSSASTVGSTTLNGQTCSKDVTIIPASKNTLSGFTHLGQNNSPIVVMAMSSDPTFAHVGLDNLKMSTKVKKLDGTLRRLNTSLRQKRSNDRLAAESAWAQGEDFELGVSFDVNFNSRRSTTTSSTVQTSKPFQLHQVLKGQGRGFSEINILSQKLK